MITSRYTLLKSSITFMTTFSWVHFNKVSKLKASHFLNDMLKLALNPSLAAIYPNVSFMWTIGFIVHSTKPGNHISTRTLLFCAKLTINPAAFFLIDLTVRITALDLMAHFIAVSTISRSLRSRTPAKNRLVIRTDDLTFFNFWYTFEIGKI